MPRPACHRDIANHASAATLAGAKTEGAMLKFAGFQCAARALEVQSRTALQTRWRIYKKTFSPSPEERREKPRWQSHPRG